MKPLFEPDVEHELHLPWRIVCLLAVRAHCEAISFDDLVREALQEYIDRTNLAHQAIQETAARYGFNVDAVLKLRFAPS